MHRNKGAPPYPAIVIKLVSNFCATFSHAGSGDEALDNALSVLSENNITDPNAAEDQSMALAVVTQRIAQLFADFDVTLGERMSRKTPRKK